MKHANRVKVTEEGRELVSVNCWGLADTVHRFMRYVQDFMEAEREGCELYTLETWTATRATFRDNWQGGQVVVEIVEA